MVETDAAESDRYVYVERPRCPRCGSPELKQTRARDQGDGSTCRTMNCASCKHHFFIIEE